MRKWGVSVHVFCEDENRIPQLLLCFCRIMSLSQLIRLPTVMDLFKWEETQPCADFSLKQYILTAKQGNCQSPQRTRKVHMIVMCVWKSFWQLPGILGTKTVLRTGISGQNGHITRRYTPDQNHWIWPCLPWFISFWVLFGGGGIVHYNWTGVLCCLSPVNGE